MKHSWFIVLVSMAACIEGEDPNDCLLDAECGSGRVCNGLNRCVGAEEVRDITVRWTINGIAPTPAMPGNCSQVTSFAVSASGAAGGFVADATCANGSAPILRIPRDFTRIGAAAYRSTADGSATVVGEASTGLPAGDEVTVDVQLR